MQQRDQSLFLKSKSNATLHTYNTNYTKPTPSSRLGSGCKSSPFTIWESC